MKPGRNFTCSAYRLGRLDALTKNVNNNPYTIGRVNGSWKRLDKKPPEWYEYNKGFNDVEIEKRAILEIPL